MSESLKPPSTLSATGEPQAVLVHPGVIPDTPHKGWTKAITVNRKWTAFEKVWMDMNLDLCREKKGEDRRNLVGWVTRQIHNYWGSTYNDDTCKDEKVHAEWKKRKKSIEDYFRNHSHRDATVDLPLNKGKVTFNAVLQIGKRQEINACATELSGGQKTGDRSWLAFYKKAEKEIKDELSDAEKEKIEEKRKEYIAKGLPPEEQARNGDEVHHIGDILQCTGGDPKGYMDIETAFRDWCIKVNKVENRKGSAAGGPTPQNGLPDATILEGKGSHMTVPEKVEGETQHYQASIIQMFINAEYGLAKHSETPMRAPWRELSEKTTHFIPVKYLPSNVKIWDPEKLKKSETDALLTHWRERQSKGKVPLQFARIKINGGDEVAVYSEHAVGPGDSMGLESSKERSPELGEIAPTLDISDQLLKSLPEIGPAYMMDLKKTRRNEKAVQEPSKVVTGGSGSLKERKSGGRKKCMGGGCTLPPSSVESELRTLAAGGGQTSSASAHIREKSVDVGSLPALPTPKTMSPLVEVPRQSDVAAAARGTLVAMPSRPQEHENTPMILAGKPRPKPTLRQLPNAETLPDIWVAVSHTKNSETPKGRRRREPSAEPPEIFNTKRSHQATAKIKDLNDKTLKSIGLLTTVTDMASSSRSKGDKKL